MFWTCELTPRSCDLTPLDYFLWGYVKSLVYADKPQTLDYLEDNNRRVIADIRPQMLEKLIENWTFRLNYIRASRDDFMRGRIIGKIEEGRKITDVAREFDIAHSVVSRLWKSFKTTGMCSRRHGEVMLEVRRLQKTDISSNQQKGTGAPQLSRWQISFLLPQESRSPEKLLPDV
ncbi:uncharacterized protein TNCV_2343191 [Trichonephila clavipes]|nr:uncharacterized protein TNCV_2343191 [Trichonephila clavipes]